MIIIINIIVIIIIGHYPSYYHQKLSQSLLGQGIALSDILGVSVALHMYECHPPEEEQNSETQSYQVKRIIDTFFFSNNVKFAGLNEFCCSYLC